MDIHLLTYRFNYFFLPLLFQDSNERNNYFEKYTLNDIYDLIYLSSGLCTLFVRNNSLKILNKYIIYIKQYQIENISIKFIENMYNFLLNYNINNNNIININLDTPNVNRLTPVDIKNHNEFLEEINHKIYVYNNLENFTNYINQNPEIINNLLKY